MRTVKGSPTVSAYLDGELAGQDLAEFESLSRTDEALGARSRQCSDASGAQSATGADILAEPIPEALLEPLPGFKPAIADSVE